MSRSPESLFDPGLQPERTALAWRRTGAALTVASLVGMRVLAPTLTPVSLAGCVAAFLFSGYVVVWAHRRYRRVSSALVTGQGASVPTDGRGPFMLAMATTVLALAAALTLVVE